MPAFTIGSMIAGIGALFSAKGQADQIRAQADAEIQAAQYNMAVAQQNANLAQQSSREDARRIRVANTKKLGNLRASAGATGLTLDSFKEVLAESAAAAELDALTTEHAGVVQASVFRREAQLASFRIASAKQVRNRSLAATFVTGAANAATSLYSGYKG